MAYIKDAPDKGDRIGGLQDSILSHILSFLQTKDAVATSILSKRWKLVWTKVPLIDIQEEADYGRDLGKRVLYKNFINNVLLLNEAPCLQSCRLTLPCERDSQYANAWINIITIRDPKEMDLNICGNLEMPSCVFSCKNLQHLTIRGGCINNMPTSVHLPNLKVINLVQLNGLSGQSLSQLTSSCPVLDELIIDVCEASEGTLHVCSSNLKKLQITRSRFDHLIVDVLSLEYLVLSNYNLSKYDISALAFLKEADIDFLGYWDYMPEDSNDSSEDSEDSDDFPKDSDNLPVDYYDSPDVSDDSLEESGDLTDTLIVTNTLNLLNCLVGSNTLRLRLNFVQGIQDYIHDQLPAFNRLTCLEMEIYEAHWWIVPMMLECTPHLFNLVLTCDSGESDMDQVSVDYDTDGNASYVTLIPSCLLNTVKAIEIRSFSDSKGSMEMVSYLLMNGSVLSEMKIFCVPSLAEDTKVLRKLLSLPRGSSCSVLIS